MYLNQGLPGECYLNLESALLSGQGWPSQTPSTLAGKTRKARFTDTCTRGLQPDQFQQVMALGPFITQGKPTNR